MCEGRLGWMLIKFLFRDSGPIMPRGLKYTQPAHSCWFGFVSAEADVCCDSMRCLFRSFREDGSESSVNSGLFEVNLSVALTDVNLP